ncbi:succinate dehydrogenase/fumarate reductase iron-sulfur subunit [Halodesulfovibrio aestuarii]|uniref:succinate dehydrogenase n=1 Tax=Halodesulfovibrio aestuarii TaxID=126333 RepID=A0ABV4JWD1_9BACT
MKDFVFFIDRYDGKNSWRQRYEFPYKPGMTVLACLIHIKENLDPTLNFTASCRSAICGACAVRVNNNALLACDTMVDTLREQWGNEPLTISPLGNAEVISDLVVKWDEKIHRLRHANTGLHAKDEFSVHEGCRQAPEDMQTIQKQWDCILCGSCASECNKLGDSKDDFLEPFIYTHAARYAEDSRSKDPMEHVQGMDKFGLWKCVHCMECVTKCPKGISPAEDIATLREASINAGGTEGPGPRHADAFLTDLRTTGRLNEVKLVPRTEGMVSAATKRLPFTMRMFARGKLGPVEAARLFIADNTPVQGIDGLHRILEANRKNHAE